MIKSLSSAILILNPISKPKIDLAEAFKMLFELVSTIVGLLYKSFNRAAKIPINPSLIELL